MRIKQLFFIGLLLLFTLGFQSQAYADQLNNSVKDCLEQPDACGEQSINSSQTDKIEDKDVVTNKGTENATSSVGLTLWDFLKMIFATVFVVGLLYFVLKFVNKKGRLFKSTQLIENLGGTALGANRSVQLIKVGHRLFIVGVGENIQLLKEIEEEQEYEQIISAYNNQINQSASPNDMITKIVERVKGKGSQKDEGNPPFQALLKKQLDDLSKGRKQLYDDLNKKKGPNKS